jgi:hypothetical protein
MNKELIQRIKEANPIEDVAADYTELKLVGNILRGLCPIHPEKHPSFYIYKETQRWFCYGCNQGGDVIELVMLKEKVTFNEAVEKLAHRKGITLDSEHTSGKEEAKAIAKTRSITLAEYAKAKGFSVDFLKSLGIGHSSGHLEFPYCNGSGEVKAVHRRWGLGGPSRFTWRRGDKVIPFGLERLSEAKERGYILITEGETDTITGLLHGFPSLGIPGASTWKPEWAEYLKDIPEVYIVPHQDQGGEALTRSVGQGFPDRLKVVNLGNAKDLNELFLSESEHFSEIFRQLLDKAELYSPPLGKRPGAEGVEKVTPELQQQVDALLASPDLVDKFLDTVSRLGQVGEENNCVMVLLAGVSRLTDSPVSLTIKGDSSSGKNTLLKRNLSLFPPSEVYFVDRLTAQALFYLRDKDLSHKILAVTEAAGSEESEYGVRIMLSEKELVIWAPVRDKGGGRMSTEEIRIAGPIAFLQTTTKAQLGSAFETRYFSIYSDSSESLTKRVLERQAMEYQGLIQTPATEEVKIWQLALGSLEPKKVIIPFAREIISQLPSTKVRIRRDNPRLMALVEASALLHQRQRQVQVQGNKEVIIGTPDDYALAYCVSSEVFAQTYKELSIGLQKFLEALEQNLSGDQKDGFTARDAVKVTKVNLRTTQRRLDDLAASGYVEVIDSGRGKRTVYSLSGEMPEELYLPPPDKFLNAPPGVAVSQLPSPDTAPPLASFKKVRQTPCRTLSHLANHDKCDTELTRPFPDTSSLSGDQGATLRQSTHSEEVLRTLPDGRVLNWQWCLSTWEKLGKPLVHAGDQDNIEDLGPIFYPEKLSPGRLQGIVTWLEKYSKETMP